MEEFVTSERFLNHPPLSEYQYQIVKASTQIYREDTLIAMYGQEKGMKRFDETYNEVILMLGKSCHAPYTPIFNPETGAWNPLDTMVADGLVTSDDGRNHYATEAFQEGYGKMVRVKTALGFVEDVYIGHKYLSYTKSRFYHRHRGYNPEFTSISELKVGDQIAVGLGMETHRPVNIPIEHAELIGYWLGDGCMPTDKNQSLNMDFCADETESIARYRQLCEYIGDFPTEFAHPSKNMYIFRHGKFSKAVSLARKYGLWGARSATKRVPDQVWAADNQVVRATLEKIWQTDGCVYLKNTDSSSQYVAEFCSVSKQLAIDVQRMLLRLGVPSAIRYRTPSSNFDNAKEAGYVTVSGHDKMSAFVSNVNLLDHKKVELLPQGHRYNRIDGPRYWDRIVSIEPIGEGPYWSRTVPETENYIGNGLISANSGKDLVSVISCCYIVYLLLCLKSPAEYYGYPDDEPIEIVNIAVNADQAKNVFFKRFRTRIKKCPWFENKFREGPNFMEFSKNVTLYSGHSEREAFEGLNLIMAVLDEISGFAMESSSGNERADTADATYQTYRNSVDSRYPDFGKVILLSWPRFKNDYISQRYHGDPLANPPVIGAVAAKEVVMRQHTFKIDNDLPDGTHGNEFTIEWEEDHITRYTFPGLFALRRPTWEVNPTKSIEDFKRNFYTNRSDALSRFACQPSETSNLTFFKNRQAIKDSFVLQNGVDQDGVFYHGFTPKEDTRYFAHVDLSKVHDRCAIAIAHVDSWRTKGVGMGRDIYPVVKVDALRWWKPTKDNPMDYQEIIDFILAVRNKGFNISLVTFDKWNSIDTMNTLKSYEIETETLGVDTKHYDDFLGVMYDERLLGPMVPELIDELQQLRLIKGKVDHPRSGYKDCSDAVCGAIFNAVSKTPRGGTAAVEVETYKNLARNEHAFEKEKVRNLIKPPMPKAMAEELGHITLDDIRLI